MKATLWNSLSSSGLTCHSNKYMGFYFGSFFSNLQMIRLHIHVKNGSSSLQVKLTDVNRAEIRRFVNAVQLQLWQKIYRWRCFRPISVSADDSSLPGTLHLMYDTRLLWCSDISNKSYFFDADSCISAPLPSWKQPANDWHLQVYNIKKIYYSHSLIVHLWWISINGKKYCYSAIWL